MKRFSPLLLISTFTIYAYPWKLLAITSFSLSSVVNCCVGDTGAPDLTSITFTSMASAALLMYRPLGVRSVCAVPQQEPRLAAIPRCGAELYPNNNTPAKEATVRLIISFIGNPPQRTFPAVQILTRTPAYVVCQRLTQSLRVDFCFHFSIRACSSGAKTREETISLPLKPLLGSAL